MKLTNLTIATAFAASLCLAAEEPAAIYKRQCASCHGPDGAGKTGAGKAFKLRALGSPAVQSQTDEQLFNVIANGKGKMPAYTKNLGHDNIHALVKYIRTFGKGAEKKQ
jgi:mono/diheme cytochrome c family protein